jgi:hypothetical protein
MALECFKILYKLSPPCLNDLVVLKNSKYSFRYFNIVEIPRVKTTTYGKNSFKYTAAVLWNDLPDDFRKIANIKQFKNAFSLFVEMVLLLYVKVLHMCYCNPHR